MTEKSPGQREAAEPESSIVDVGELARTLQPPASATAALLWWGVFFVLVAACVWPNPGTVSAVWVYVVILVWSREARRRVFLRNLVQSPCLSRASTADRRNDWPKVTVLVPARDEEYALEQSARALCALPYPNLDVWFVNDHSTDRTPQILDAIQREFPRAHVLHDPPIVEGWFGKSNALWQIFLATEREPDRSNRDGDWLLFVDADVVLEPGLIEQAVSVAEREGLDFLTCMPKLITKTWAEQLLLPTGWRGIAQGADQKRLNDPGTFPIGIGAFILVRRAAYRAFGGHKALGGWHPEDTLFAAAVKKIGGRVGFAWTPDLMRVRFYTGYLEVKQHTLRKTRIFFGEHVHLPLTMMAMRLSTTLIALPMLAAGVIPQLAAGRFDALLTLLAVAGLTLYINEALEYRGVNQIAEFHPLVPWLHPVSGVLRVWFALSLLWQIVANTPMEWRGRLAFGEDRSLP